MAMIFVFVRRDLFYLLDYVTRRSENWDLQKKKNGSATNWRENVYPGYTYQSLKKLYLANLSKSFYKYNYKVVNSNNWALSKIVHCKCYLTSEIYGT